MSGGKGGSSTSQVTIPEYIEAAAQRNLNKAERISQLGYVPQYGPSVAAFTPMQQSGFQNTANLAGAFGMAAPTSQQDIMGGMGAPTTYAGGVQGYSSAPLYDQMVSELAARRPAQKSYIDSFFIDPTSGNYAYQPFDYTQYNTMAQDARVQADANRVNDMAIAQMQAGPAEAYNTSTTSMNTPLSYLPGGVNDPFLTSAPSQAIAGLSTPSDMVVTTSDTTSSLTGETLPAGSYVRPGSAAPTTSIRPVARPDSGSSSSSSSSSSAPTTSIRPVARPSGGSSNDSSSSPSTGSSSSGGYTSFSDMFDGGGPGQSGDTYQGGGVVSSVGNAVTGSGSGGGGGGSSSSGGGSRKILCCAYYNLGYLPREIWRLDQRYGVWLHRNDPELMRGYHAWAAPLADFVQEDTAVSKVVRAIMWPIVKAWAEEMAHKQRPDKYKANIAGKAITFVGEAFSRLCGKLKPRSIEGAV